MDTDLIKAQTQSGEPFLTFRHADSTGFSHLEVTMHMDARSLPNDRDAAVDHLLGMAISRLYLQRKARAQMRGEPSPPAPWEKYEEE